MLTFLNNDELQLIEDIKKIRSLGRELTAEEQLMLELLHHNWSFAKSDDLEEWRQGRSAASNLIAKVKASDLNENRKAGLIQYLDGTKTEQEAEEMLKSWSYLNAAIWRKEYPADGKVGMFYKGVTDVQYAQFLKLTQEIKALVERVAAARALNRLIMTDDVIAYNLVRECAIRDLKEHKSDFFFGAALPDTTQQLMDDLVRFDKELFIAYVETGAAKEMLHSIKVDTNNPDGVWLVKLSTTNRHQETIGFFINPKPTRPRREFKKKSDEPRKPLFDPINSPGKHRAAVAQRMEETAIIPTLPRKKPQPALGNKPMVVKESATPKKAKAPAAKRKREFVNLADLQTQADS